MKLTALNYALLGLIQETPRSGYALRQVFESTPMGNFSSSPGSIYPALKKLNDAQLIRKASGDNPKKSIFVITDEGANMLDLWLNASVTEADVNDNIDAVLLKFAFLQSVKDLSITHQFLSSSAQVLNVQISELQSFLNSSQARSLSIHGRLAVENGLAGLKAHLVWTQRAKEKFE